MEMFKNILKIGKYKILPLFVNNHKDGESHKPDQRMGLRMQLTAFLNSIFGIILLIIALASDHWCGRESDRLTIYEGLWTKCTIHHHEDGLPKKCVELEGTFGHESYLFYPVLVFLFLTCIVYLVTFVMSIILLCKSTNVKLAKALAIVHFIVLILDITGNAIYATTFDDNYYALKWSSALGWGSTLCFFAAFVFTLIDIDRKK